MAFKIKCESCGSTIHKVWDTLSFYQTITDGGIVECKQCKARYKSKYQTSFFDGRVKLASSIMIILLIAFAWNDFSLPFSFKQEPTPDLRTMYAKLTGTELPQSNFFLPMEQDEWNTIGLELLADNANPYGNILITILSIIAFVAALNILNFIVIFFMPLRRIDVNDESFWDIKQKD
ncbi:hypothetical protein [Helicobacter trogontum]|uniref:Uncharacterized protein n=1 Tax=Helicobacter trogontum TaxID=50960 RepID=A0A099VIU4_9HELI|nr:hypothetical protein [Helicobacter trogontum]TLD79708.1 hypothetical protein LS81_010400 [Helicobacter trogontum]